MEKPSGSPVRVASTQSVVNLRADPRALLKEQRDRQRFVQLHNYFNSVLVNERQAFYSCARRKTSAQTVKSGPRPHNLPKNTTAKLAAAPNREAAVTGTTALCYIEELRKTRPYLNHRAQQANTSQNAANAP
jgi:hypothetical protein